MSETTEGIESALEMAVSCILGVECEEVEEERGKKVEGE